MSLKAILIVGVLCAACVAGWLRFGNSLVRRMEADQAFTRYAMEYHRAHPRHRRNDPVLETWSTADQIAEAVTKQNFQLPWVATSDQLDFLDVMLKRDMYSRPFCVAQRQDAIIVIDFGNRPSPTLTCDLETLVNVDLSRVKSGDMLFADRSDWIYVLRTPPAQPTAQGQ